MALERQVDLFSDSLSSERTREQYKFHLQKYLSFVGSNGNTSTNNPSEITSNIIRYLVKLKDENLSFSHRNTSICAIRHYYEMHDIVLNWKKIRRFLGEKTAANNLRGYTRQEIYRLINVADPRYRAIILVYASTGMRREALVQIKLSDMEYLEEYKLYKIKVYRKTQHEYVCFTTPEAAEAIDICFQNKIRRKIRDDFYFHKVDAEAITKKIRDLSIQANIGQSHPKLESESSRHNGLFRDNIPAVHGLRKFCITQMAKAKVDTEVAKILTDHTIGVRAKYLDYTDDDLLREYLKAVDNLTINEENRLKIRVQELASKTESNEYIIRAKLQEKDEQIKTITDQFFQIKNQMQSLLSSLNSINENEKSNFAKQLFKSGIYKQD